ncbi:hypothetical protein F4677DRAFT_310128 [Hypoxylon crocopeplum]|nr:hypothetical protein F4677DRAFT_310128 [Hypoxylon crocopeplum]
MAAAGAATLMPKLEIMEIWNGGEGHACLFRYENMGGRRHINWKCNWSGRMRFDAAMVDCWVNLPNHTRQYPLTLTVGRLREPRSQVKTYVPTVGYLKMRGAILDSVSRYQHFWEEYHPRRLI